MSSEKKVIFSATDNVSQKAQQMYSNILAGAKKHSEVLKEQTGYINQQIKALEKKTKLEQKQGERIFQEQGELYRAARNPAERERYAQASARVRSELNESKAILETLLKIWEESKKQTTTSARVETEQKYEYKSNREKDAAQGFTWIRNGEGGGTRTKSPFFSNTKKFEAQWAKNQARENEIREERESQKEKKKKEKSVVGEVFLGTFLADVLKQTLKSLTSLVGNSSGEQGVNTLLGGIPLVGGLLGGASGRTFEEQLAIQTKELELGAKTGSNVKGLSDKTNLGYSTRETLSMIESLISASGSSKGAGSAGNALTLQRGLGLSQDVITQIVKDLRTTRSSADIMQIASDVLAANPELRKDQTKFAEILQQTSQLTNQLASQTEKSDPRRNAGLVGALRSIGGSFADPVLGVQRMMSINQALTSPGTDYQKSRSFGVLSGANPGASYFQILEAQEKGIGSKGYLGGLLKQLRRETGGGEEFMLGVNQNLGLKASTSRKLVEAFEKNPKMFDNLALGGKDGIEKVLGISGRAEAATSQRDKEKAEIDNAFSMSATAGTLKVASLTFEAAVDMFQTSVVSITNALSNASGKMGTQKPSKRDPSGKNSVNVMKMGANGILIDANGETSE